MANKEHLAILRQGVEAWNEWRDRNADQKPDLSGAHLSKANLSRANLSGANLAEADLSRAHLSGANLFQAHLSRAHLMEADLSVATFTVENLTPMFFGSMFSITTFPTNLSGANLSGANLSGADLGGANLGGANLSEARLAYTIFGDVDLSEVVGLGTINHRGPSTIGIDTIYKSKGKIPDVFLRGAGVPENFIVYARSLVVQPIQYQSCFISYSTKDDEFARRLHSRMQSEKLRVWFAPEDVQGGKKLFEQLERAIQIHDRLLLVLSENSMKSEWVMTEIRKARKAELKEKRRKLFPIRLVDFETLKAWECIDPDTGEDLALEVRRYFIPDFSEWKDHDAFESAFANLLRDLKAEDTSPAARTEA